jgi:hypothetical protein
VRVATFNLENLDETAAGDRRSLAKRVALMKPQIIRLRADIACFARSGTAGQPRVLLALAELLTGHEAGRSGAGQHQAARRHRPAVAYRPLLDGHGWLHRPARPWSVILGEETLWASKFLNRR